MSHAAFLRAQADWLTPPEDDEIECMCNALDDPDCECTCLEAAEADDLARREEAELARYEAREDRWYNDD